MKKSLIAQLGERNFAVWAKNVVLWLQIKRIKIMFIKILDWQFTIVKIEIEKLKFTIDDKYMTYI